ncbi:RNA 2',3'-cyclic phosphodiesterase [Thalassobacillus devorans]|uniref:RNA 2',3'-cyclic phosphodiesterase n=1 Tax=Thalassobacillus devorans TaxID=279813 RepID=A0ABQ1PBX2_9BACI|nr:RNA 2',3'-cyclic phosphodiesterase [Thalassobacillus devorans]NIK29957.1 2'-5' RNA ligase [Thalassobacillus devorans]GGC94201.1 RNA 2',3'-cyclic phosphodiesterase [Thalassobacillus devorans]
MGGYPHYFVGIPISEEIRQVLTEWQKDLGSSVSYKTWTHRNDFHITLKFLGAVADDKIEEVKKRLHDSKYPEYFAVKAADLSFFGHKQRPRVLFMGVENHPSLQKVKEMVEQALKQAGFPKENRPYRPHITLAKKWDQKQDKPFSIEQLEKYKRAITFTIDRFHLYRIHPGEFPKYEVIDTVELG